MAKGKSSRKSRGGGSLSARSQREAVQVKPRSDLATVLLVLAFAALGVAIALTYVELDKFYDFWHEQDRGPSVSSTE